MITVADENTSQCYTPAPLAQAYHLVTKQKQIYVVYVYIYIYIIQLVDPPTYELRQYL